MLSVKKLREKYLKKELLPTMFCPGCGIGCILNYSLQAIEKLQIDQNKLVFVSGIGCSSRLPSYIKAYGLHTTHGRAIAFATGIKVTNPDLTVIVFTGDGDCIGIGGNHLIHGIRRNIDITVIVVNNMNYGMTGGQYSPTTPLNAKVSTAPMGTIEYPLNLAGLATVAGAPYVARWTIAHPFQCIGAIEKGLMKKGFSFIEILSPCPTHYGRWNISRNIKDSLSWLKENTIKSKIYSLRTELDPFRISYIIGDKITVGEFAYFEKPTFIEQWKTLTKRMKEEYLVNVSEKGHNKNPD
ncbi:MAG: thiamine pyrophosphate-dependent enzyme [Promethearchaeota archaeon]